MTAPGGWREFEVPAALDGERLDRVVALVADLSRRRAADLLATGRVRVGDDGDVPTRSQRVRVGTRVTVEVPLEETEDLEPDPDVEVPVVHADEHLVVVDKPAGTVVHPGAGVHAGTLVHGLLARFPDIAGVGEVHRPGVVHRLDAGTSGLLVVARTEEARRALAAQLEARQVERRYLVGVAGRPEAPRGVVDAPIGRSARDRTRMAVVADGRPARTRYELTAAFTRPLEAALLACTLETGRTHQIRVHLAAIGHPVLADPVYGRHDRAGALLGLERPFLHAAHLAFVHPATGGRVAFDAPTPADLAGALARLH